MANLALLPTSRPKAMRSNRNERTQARAAVQFEKYQGLGNNFILVRLARRLRFTCTPTRGVRSRYFRIEHKHMPLQL